MKRARSASLKDKQDAKPSSNGSKPNSKTHLVHGRPVASPREGMDHVISIHGSLPYSSCESFVMVHATPIGPPLVNVVHGKIKSVFHVVQARKQALLHHHTARVIQGMIQWSS